MVLSFLLLGRFGTLGNPLYAMFFDLRPFWGIFLGVILNFFDVF